MLTLPRFVDRTASPRESNHRSISPAKNKKKEGGLASDRLPFYDRSESGAADQAVRRGAAGLGGQRVARNCGPAGGRTSNRSERNRHVLRRGEALRRTVAREVRTRTVCGVALFVGRAVAKVSLHRCEISLLLRVGELRNRDRGKNADNHDNDQKLDQRETLFALCHFRPLKVNAAVDYLPKDEGHCKTQQGSNSARRNLFLA